MTSPALPIYRKHRERRMINDALGTQPAQTDWDMLQDRALQQQELQGKEMEWKPVNEKTLSKAMCGLRLLNQISKLSKKKKLGKSEHITGHLMI